MLLIAGMIASTSAQNEKSGKVKELGITFYNLNSFGVRYKTGSEKTLLRLNIAVMNIGHSKSSIEVQDSLPIKTTNLSAGAKAGFESRIPIVKNLDFLIGLDGGIFSGYNYTDFSEHSGYTVDNTAYWDVSPELDLVLGFNYHIGSNFCVSAEIDPALIYSHAEFISKRQVNESSTEKTTKYISNRVNFGLSSTSASITISYVFRK